MCRGRGKGQEEPALGKLRPMGERSCCCCSYCALWKMPGGTNDEGNRDTAMSEKERLMSEHVREASEITKLVYVCISRLTNRQYC